MKQMLAIIGVGILLTACTPYHSKYMCESARDFGKCSDVKGAYDAALRASPPEKVDIKDKKSLKKQKKEMSATALNVVAAQDMYRAREYQQLAAILDKPMVPLVKAPTALRTLVVSYSTGKTLYMPRYIYFLDDEANFVLGDYLTPRDSGGPMIVPTTLTRANGSGASAPGNSPKQAPPAPSQQQANAASKKSK